MNRMIARFLFWLLKGQCPHCGCKKAKHLRALFYECAYCAGGFELKWVKRP